MNLQTRSTRTLGLGLAVAGVMAFGLAPAAARADDPGVARISNLQSNVAIKRGDSGDTVAAAINAPVMAGDYLTTGEDSRAEVQFDNADMLRAGSDAQLRFTQLGPSGDTTQLAAGTVEVRVFQQSAPLEIDTPSITVRPSGAGAYRVTVDDSGATVVTVRHGEASIVTPQGTQSLGEGSSLQASGSAANPQIQNVAYVATDDFDSWNDQRDQVIASASGETQQYVNQGVVGSSDLAADGTWQDNSTYGEAWYPSNVAPGWAPYTDGQWAWEGYYGWTWVSYEPWGWAPYHYGRWFYNNNRWGWAPGPVYARPVWSPALVGFFGFGRGLSVGIGFGNIGWVPLAPYETYHPWYGHGGYGGTNINININTYHNYNAPGAISGIGTGAWNNGTFGRRVTLPPGEIHNVTALRGTLPITPTHQNLTFNRMAINSGNLPRPHTVAFTGFASRPVANPVPFEQQRQRVQESTRSAYSSTTTRTNAYAPTTTRTNTYGPTAGRTNGYAPATTGTHLDAWSRFNTAHGNTTYRSTQPQHGSTTSSGRTYSPSSSSNGSTHTENNSSGNNRPPLAYDSYGRSDASTYERGDTTNTYDRAETQTYRPETQTYRPEQSYPTQSYRPANQAFSSAGQQYRSTPNYQPSYRTSYQSAPARSYQSAPQRSYQTYRSAPSTSRSSYQTQRSQPSQSSSHNDHQHN